MLYIKPFYCNPYRECTYIITANDPSDEPQECLIVDPGMYGEKEEKRVLGFLVEHLLTPVILITHRHPDHVCGLEAIQARFPDIPLYGYDYTRTDDETTPVSLAELSFRMLHTPGHKEDSICYYFESDKILFTGDTIFKESVGRTDLGGNSQDMMQSLRKLKSISEDYKVYCGHFESTTLAREQKNNPYFIA